MVVLSDVYGRGRHDWMVEVGPTCVPFGVRTSTVRTTGFSQFFSNRRSHIYHRPSGCERHNPSPTPLRARPFSAFFRLFSSSCPSLTMRSAAPFLLLLSAARSCIPADKLRQALDAQTLDAQTLDGGAPSSASSGYGPLETWDFCDGCAGCSFKQLFVNEDGFDRDISNWDTA
mmetsp:Transcript_29437/g.67690  ORF Transcript_29437/g.67690 Transcript_29437/m.67690 type:complete len:173 (+) Transcript_29437:470-988(+)